MTIVIKSDFPSTHWHVDQSQDDTTIDEVTQKLPSGVYTTFRTYFRDRILHLSMHIHRLEESARLLNQEIQVDPTTIKIGLRTMRANFTVPEYRIRLLLDLEGHPGDLYLIAGILDPVPSEDYIHGVRVRSLHASRENPHVKSTEFIPIAQKLRLGEHTEFHEIIMIGTDGEILEGLSSNFFAVVQGEIWTAFDGVLEGITRSIVLNLIQANKFHLVTRGLPIQKGDEVDEAFITSSSRGILPVAQVDDKFVRSRIPGPYTSQLSRAYQNYIEENLEIF